MQVAEGKKASDVWNWFENKDDKMTHDGWLALETLCWERPERRGTLAPLGPGWLAGGVEEGWEPFES